ncbi:MAG: hypothetical protein LBQ50_04250 [Planctomycetaceae bacterium]|jgi:hypothetical protein|nr:hypothetical protein [Planctomycetaceae bacterium]
MFNAYFARPTKRKSIHLFSVCAQTLKKQNRQLQENDGSFVFLTESVSTDKINNFRKIEKIIDVNFENMGNIGGFGLKNNFNNDRVVLVKDKISVNDYNFENEILKFLFFSKV